MLDMLKQTIESVKEKLTQEKQAREKTEETLIDLLEQTCTKLNRVNLDI